MSTLYLLHFNNYYNRQVLRSADLVSYHPFLVKYNEQMTDPNGNEPIILGVNFNENDFVDTVQVVNWAGDIPDYLLVVEDNNIISRWFVLDAQKVRGGQLSLTLHRDLIVDYYDNLMSDDTSIFVEKANLLSDNDLIFNKEDMTFNQIKTSETLIKDASECPWICIYAAGTQADGTSTTFDIESLLNIPLSRQFSSVSEFNSWDIKKAYDNNTEIAGGDVRFLFININVKNSAETVYAQFIVNENDTFLQRLDSPSGSFMVINSSTVQSTVEYAFRPIYTGVKTALTDYTEGYNDLLYNELAQYSNQFVSVVQADGTKKYYKITYNQYGKRRYFTPNPLGASGQLYSIISPSLHIIGPTGQSFSNIAPVTFDYEYSTRKVVIQDVTASVMQIVAHITGARYHLSDAPYDMFCIPYSDSLIIKNSAETGFTEVTSNKQLANTIARALIEKYTGANQIYDAQILPYCPLTSTIVSKSGDIVTLDLNDESGYIYTPVLDGTTVVGYILHASVSSFNREITLDDPIIIKDYKIESECDIYRLCSPNYASVFEFNAAKNGGVSTIRIQATYKPFTPYIKLFPTWGRLYGSNFGEDGFDARGLICGGDFSLPMITNQWATYELQNKNYQASFDRQIENLEINNRIQREREIWGLAAGVIGGGVQGASGGLSLGGPIGAAIGGVVATGLSIGGGIRDLQLNDKLRAETIDYTKDQFGYQLGNIKALPQALSKTSAYNVDNKYFPFLEYFTCSEEEKQALRDKIRYNGMTVMVVGTMREYVENNNTGRLMYFKGKLIRLAPDGFNGNYHILNSLANELYKGVFI